MTPTRDQLIARAKAKGKSDAEAASLADAYLAKAGAQDPNPEAPKPSPVITRHVAPSPTGASPKAVASRAMAAIERQERARVPQRLQPGREVNTPEALAKAPLPTPRPGSLGEGNPDYRDAATRERGRTALLADTMDSIIMRGLTESPEALLAGHRSGKRPIRDPDLLSDLDRYERLSRELDDTRDFRKALDAPRVPGPDAPLTSVADLRRQDQREMRSGTTDDAVDLSRRMAKAYMDEGEAPRPTPIPIPSAMAYDDAELDALIEKRKRKSDARP